MKLKETAEVEQVKHVDRLLKANINLIPVDNWGFDDETKDQIRNRKHRIVNSLLTRAEKKKLSNAAKHLVAREVGCSFQTVTEVFGWLKQFSKGMRPRKRPINNEQSTSVTDSLSEVWNEDAEGLGNSALESTKRKKIEKKSVDYHVLQNSTTDSLSELKNGEKTVSVAEDVKHSENVKLSTTSTSRGKRKTKEQANTEMKKKCLNVPTVNEDIEKINLPKLPAFTDRSLAMQKLQAKIGQLKSIRCGKKTPEQYEDFRKAKRRLSKMKLHEKRKKSKQSNKSDVKQKNSEEKDVKSDLGVPNDLLKDSEKIVYSKFDFLVKDGPKKLTKSEKRDKFTGKNFKGLLEKAEKRADRIEKIRGSNPEKAQRIEENILWKKAMNRTEGQKVKDDPLLLKKGIMKKEKIKERRKRKWEQRNDYIKQKQEQRQEKRSANIQLRKDMKKKKSLEKARKKGRFV